MPADTPYTNQSTGVQSAKVIGGRAGMGGVTEGGPGDWAWTQVSRRDLLII